MFSQFGTLLGLFISISFILHSASFFDDELAFQLAELLLLLLCLTASFPGQPQYAGTRKAELWILMKQEMMWWHKDIRYNQSMMLSADCVYTRHRW